MTVLDVSAVLAFLQGESGADVVEAALLAGATCGAAKLVGGGPANARIGT